MRHVLRNIMPILIIVFSSVVIIILIMAEASLSFLGFGLPAQIPSWGGMLSREGRTHMAGEGCSAGDGLAIWPGLFLTTTVYCLNMLGDAMRDLLDPRLRGGES